MAKKITVKTGKRKASVTRTTAKRSASGTYTKSAGTGKSKKTSKK